MRGEFCGCPPATNPRVGDWQPAPVKYVVCSIRSPKSLAVPVDAIVKKSIILLLTPGVGDVPPFVKPRVLSETPAGYHLATDISPKSFPPP